MKKMHLLLVLLFLSSAIFAQSDLHIFGFYQAKLQKVDGDFKIAGDVPTPIGPVNTTFDEANDDFLDSGVQQLNIFASKGITDNISSFINLQVVNNFSSGKNWGSMSLEEAWVKYEYSDYLKVQFGYLIPKFNSLNEIKNRTPLQPYVVRPLVYEAAYEGLIDPSAYLPERAFVQVTGNVPFGKLIFDYSAFAGSAERDYITEVNSGGPVDAGSDTTNIKMFGGRVGLSFNDFVLGVSFTTDKDNQQASIGEDVDRKRIGFDFNYTKFNFFAEAEYIKVMMDAENTTDDQDKSFYYGVLGYNFGEKLYAYTGYSYMEDKQVDFLETGLKAITVGAGFRPVYSVVVKLEYGTYFVADDAKVFIPVNPAIPPVESDLDLDYTSINLAVSVIF